MITGPRPPPPRPGAAPRRSPRSPRSGRSPPVRPAPGRDPAGADPLRRVTLAPRRPDGSGRPIRSGRTIRPARRPPVGWPLGGRSSRAGPAPPSRPRGPRVSSRGPVTPGSTPRPPRSGAIPRDRRPLVTWSGEDRPSPPSRRAAGPSAHLGCPPSRSSRAGRTSSPRPRPRGSPSSLPRSGRRVAPGRSPRPGPAAANGGSRLGSSRPPSPTSCMGSPAAVAGTRGFGRSPKVRSGAGRFWATGTGALRPSGRAKASGPRRGRDGLDTGGAGSSR